MDWVKELLKGVVDSEKLDSIVESFDKEFPKYAVPKKDFNEKNDELKLAKSQIDENKKLLDDLNKKAASVEEYEKNLNEYKTKYDQLEANSVKEIESIKKKTGFQLKLNDHFIEDSVPLLIENYNFDEVILGQEGDILEFDKHIAKLKEKYPRLAKEVQQSTPDVNPKPNADVDTSSMSDEEFYKNQGVKPLW